MATLLWALLPETKGRSLEQMLQYFVKITGDTSGQMSDLTKPNAVGQAAAKRAALRLWELLWASLRRQVSNGAKCSRLG